MKNLREVQRMYKSRVFRELKRSFRKYLSRNPTNCKYNKLSPVFADAEQKVGVCLNFSKMEEVKLDNGVWICDCVADAANCNKFDCKYTKEDIKTAFEKEVLGNAEKLVNHYKDLFILRWVLQEGLSTPWYRRWWLVVTEFFGKEKPLEDVNESNNID